MALTLGTEIELGWEGDAGNAPNWFSAVSDNSIDGSHSRFSGEWVSPPFTQIARYKEQVKALFNALRPLHVNSTMGYHIHVGFTDADDYQKILSWKFAAKFMKDVVKKFPELGKRLENRYCQEFLNKADFNSLVMSQLYAPQKFNSRYKAVNYCYTIRKTVEFRLFKSAKNYDTLVNYVRWLKQYITKYLEETPQLHEEVRIEKPTDIDQEQVSETKINVDEKREKTFSAAAKKFAELQGAGG